MTNLLKFRISFLLTLCLAALPLHAEQIEFHHALELALTHSGVMRAVTAQRAKAIQQYKVERYAYLPSIVFGANPGYSFGVAISVAGQIPSLYNVSHNQALFNLALSDNIKAARVEEAAAELDYHDRADQVVLDTALLYIELDSTLQRLDAAHEQKTAMDKALYIAQQREKEGFFSPLDVKRSELEVARVDLRITELESAADYLRERLARNIGLPSSSLDTVAASIPPAPTPETIQDVASVALANSTAVRVADDHAQAARFRARAEHRVNYPSIDLGGQFAQLAPYLNYGLTKTSKYNYSFAVSIRVPLFNLSQNAKAAVAEAEAMRVEAEAQNLRDQVAADAVHSQRAIQQLQAVAKVTRLEYEVAEANIDAVQFQVQSGKANAHDQELAKADMLNHRVSLLQSQFEYMRAELQLLRQTGELHQWAFGK